MSLQFAADNPYRPPNWRWQRALAIHDRIPGSPAPSRKRDGPIGFKWINKAIQFLTEYRRNPSEEGRAALAERRPEIFWAHWVAMAENNPTRHVIEAQILARSTNHDIGFRCNMPPKYVEVYEALFFNVREKLQHRSYILNVVIGPAIHRGISEREYDLLWKLYGYFLGPAIIDALEGKFVNPMWCQDATSLNAAIMDDAVNTLKLKAALAAKTIQVNQHTQLAIMDTFTKFVEVERNSDSSGKAQEQILDHIQAMMTTLPFNVGGRQSLTITAKSSNDMFNKTALELNFEETMQMSVGQSIPHENTLRNLTFPITEATQTIGAH